MSKPTKSTLTALRTKRRDGIPLAMITCYDYAMAHLVEEAELDMVLVGDSLGMTMLGYDSTLPVTLDDMVRHTQAVRRGAPSVFLVADMPYMSYHPSNETAIRSAGRLMAETGADAVKLEGGREVLPRLRAIVDAGIPVMGHLGLTPQSASALGGFRLQGKTAADAARIVEDASLVERAGAFSVLLELVPDAVCRLVTEQAERLLVLGLGSGPDAHGQLLIFHDVFGLYPRFKPRMARLYEDAGTLIRRGLERYRRDVREGAFPARENWFPMADEELAELERTLRSRDRAPR